MNAAGTALAHRRRLAGDGRRFLRAYPAVAEALNRFAAESETRFGSSVGVRLRVLSAGASTSHVLFVLHCRGRSAVAACVVWGDGDAVLTCKGRIMRLTAPHAANSAVVAFKRLLEEKLLAALDMLFAEAA